MHTQAISSKKEKLQATTFKKQSISFTNETQLPQTNSFFNLITSEPEGSSMILEISLTQLT